MVHAINHNEYLPTKHINHIKHRKGKYENKIIKDKKMEIYLSWKTN